MSDTLLPAGHRGEDLLETLESAEVAFRGGRLLSAKNAGSLGGGQFLEVTQRQNLAVHRVEGVERFLQAQDTLGANNLLRRRGVLAEQLSRQGRRTRCRQGATVERDLATNIPHLRAEVL